MKIFTHLNSCDFPSVVTFGNFDGVHCGHISLFSHIGDIARKNSLCRILVTFDPHPICFLHGVGDFLITSTEKKLELLSRYFDYVYCLQFDSGLSCISPRNFIADLCSRLNIKYLVSGETAKFGFEGRGSVQHLKQYATELSYIPVIVTPKLLDSSICSSTLIRELLKSGHCERVSFFLGRPHSFCGEVVRDKGLATKIGHPTANLMLNDNILKPKFGVYSSQVLLRDGAVYNAITNIGVRPTISGDTRISLETHIFDFSEMIYGQTIEVFIHRFIREEKKFTSIDDLKNQIKIDIAEILSKTSV